MLLKRLGFIFYFFLVLGIAIFIYGRAAHLFTFRPLFNDDYSLGYPLRILVSTALRNGILPLWDH